MAEKIIKMKAFYLKILILCLLSIVVSCSYTKQLYTPDEMRLYIRQMISPEASERIIVPFEVNDEIRKVAREATGGLNTDREKIFALLYKVLDKNDVDLQYDQYKTYTAIETYESGRGNCLSFTNLLVGMARSLGIEAFYVEVMREGEYDLLEGLVVNQRHICAGYELGGKVELVDFAVNARKYLSNKRLDDIEGVANYFNNKGYDLLKDGKIDDAVVIFQMAVDICPTFSWGYNNLAVALSRKGDIQGAARNYKKALELDSSYEAPYGNLASLYYNMGEREQAERYLDLLDKIKSKNPYLHVARGVMLKEQKAYDKAMKEMKKALSLDRKNVKARIEIAKLYIEIGEPRPAARHLKTALRLSPDDQEARQLLASIEKKP